MTKMSWWMNAGRVGQVPPHQEVSGPNAIVFLQSLVGLSETLEDATKGWDKLSPMERLVTRIAYDVAKSMTTDTVTSAVAKRYRDTDESEAIIDD